MTRQLHLVLVLALAVPAFGEEPAAQAKTPEATAVTAAAADTQAPEPTKYSFRQIEFGLQGVDSDTNSSRFREYRALPTGIVMPYLRFAGNERFRYDVIAKNVLQNDARYDVLLAPGRFEIEASYAKIPHSFGNGARTLLVEQGTGNWLISDTLQQSLQRSIEGQFAISKPGVNYAFLNNLVTPSLAAANVVDLKLLREQGNIAVKLTKDSPLDVRATYFNENRRGTRAAGTAFGFGNVIEAPEPIQYRTQDYGFSAEYSRPWGLLRGALNYNDFTNRVQNQTFDNPFRVTDAADASAYQAPGSASIAGARYGKVSLPPDSKALTGSVGLVAKFKGHSRLNASAAIGEWTQDSPFMPLTTNSAVVVPQQGLPGSLDGKIKTVSLAAALTSNPVPKLRLGARFRRYDLTNDTPRVEFPEGYVRYDGVFEDIPRISVPYGYASDSFTLMASYMLGKATLEGGYKYEGFDRTFRETEQTTQNVVYLKFDLRTSDWLVLHATAETGSRDFEGLELELSEEASFLVHSTPVNLLAVPSNTVCPSGTICNLRYDQAAKDLQRIGAYADLTPDQGRTTLTVSYLRGKDDYKDSSYGLLTADNQAFSGELNFTPSERFNLFGFYTREQIKNFQRGRQSGATVSVRPIDDWTSTVEDKVNSFGGGANFGLVKDKADLKLFGNYQKVDGDNAIASATGGTPAVARVATGGITSIPLYDDTKLWMFSAELGYKATQQLRLSLGGFYESYELADSNTTGITNYMPASFFLAANDSDYDGYVFYVRGSYAW